ncbi:DUF4352 domain-containing protein [Actinomadura logoneensis]|uniref:DUF4352 domain-containing protein n=1 Tax=Actinomadura logoneensis TaxID=2293572 RepID=A0A372JHJ9_9ACTN|nr:DUF4352 domain-containing protein [Actinomadura logoneensis]RFU39420.1 DUF4352 domain-containing protein [Actinomadura logoneensis]
MNPNQPPLHVQGPAPKKGGAGKGCLIAAGGTLGLLVLLGACGALIGSAGGSPGAPQKKPSTTSTAASRATKAETKQPKPSPTITNGIGHEYRDGKFAFTVTKVKKGVERVGDEYLGKSAQGQYVFVYLQIANIGKKSQTFFGSNQTLVDTRGRIFEVDNEAAAYLGEEAKSLFEEINPGNAVKGILVYDVPRGTRFRELRLHDSMFSGGVTVPLGGH